MAFAQSRVRLCLFQYIRLRQMIAPINERPPQPWIYPLALLAYLAAFRLGLLSSLSAQHIASVWPASGLAVWLVIRYGYRILGAVALGEFIAGWLVERPVSTLSAVLMLAVLGSGNALAAGLGGWFWRREATRWQALTQESQVPARCLAVALFSPLVGATIGVGALIIFGTMPPGEAPKAWFVWWTSDVVGVLFLLPLLLTVSSLFRKMRDASASDVVRGTILFVALQFVCWVSFGRAQRAEFLFVFFPLLVLATGWFGAAGAQCVAFTLAVAGIVAAANGHGPLSTGSVSEDLLNVQLFLSAIAVVALVLPPIHARLNLFRRWPLALLLGGWILSALLFTLVRLQQERVAEDAFSTHVDHAQEDIRERLTTYTEALRSAVSFLNASQQVERARWTAFADTLDLPRRYPGIDGLGVVLPVSPEQTAAFLETVRGDGAPDFTLHSISGAPTQAGNDHYVLTYLAPLSGHHSALGLDLATEAKRREAADAARDSGDARLTTQIDLQRDRETQPGFLLYLPVYRKDAPIATMAERRAALQAWIAAPLITEQFFTGILGARRETLSLYFFEGSQTDPNHLLYTTAAHPTGRLPNFREVHSLELAGQKFTLGWTHGGKFVVPHQSPLMWLAVSFAVATVLLVGWLLNLQNFREQAEALVTERTAALQGSQANYRALSEASTSGIWQLNNHGETEYINRSMCQMLEIDHPDELIGRTYHRFFSPSSLETIQREYLKRPYNIISTYEVELLGQRGGRREAMVGGAPLFDPQGKLRGVIGTFTDITALKQTEAALRESDARFRSLVDSTDGIVWEADAITWVFNSVSKNAERLLGYPVTDWLQPGFWADHLHPEDRDQAINLCTACTGRLEDHDFIYRFMAQDGRIVWLRDIIKVIAENGKPRWLRGLMIDITTQKQAEAERQQFERKLQDAQKLESLGVLAGGIAHDFNNILTGILGNASLASRELASDSPMQDYLETIKQGSLRAADLCKQMLAYSGKGRFVVKRISLNSIVEETTHLLQISINKKAELRFDLHPGLPAIDADTTQIRQIIMNLVINASEAIGEKGGTISLHTGLTRVNRAYLGSTLLAPELPEGDYVTLEVADTGCGMSPETQAKIFDPFFTTKFTGRGLGLAAVLGIVRGHHGALKIYSELGRGTTFKLLFPCAPGGADRVAIPDAPKSTWRGHGCVLVVDDEESIRTTAALMLRKLGFETAPAADGRAAVEAFRAEPDRFTFVLMDLTMPHLDGEQAFTEMRLIRPAARVVLMSGFNEQEAISRFTGKGLASFLQKPFTFEALSETIQRGLTNAPGLK